jgi:hypothetical protein
MPDNPQPYTSDVLDTIRRDSDNIAWIASKAGVSPLDIAAPIAREMNKQAVGDYWWSGLLAIPTIKNHIVNYQPNIDPDTGNVSHVPVTHDYLAADYDRVTSGKIGNRGLSGQWNRYENPVLNDIGPGKMQIGTAITLLNDCVKSGNCDGDPLDLKKYVGHYDQLVKDMQDPATQYDLAYKLYALNAKQAQNFFVEQFGGGEAGAARWNSYSPKEQAAMVTAYGAMGPDQLKAKAESAAPGAWKPDLGNTDGASYTLKGSNPDDLNAALQGRSSMESPDATRADLAPAGTGRTVSIWPNYDGAVGFQRPEILGGGMPPGIPDPVFRLPFAPGNLFGSSQPNLTGYGDGFFAPLAASPMTPQPYQSLGRTPAPGGPFDWPQSNPTDYGWLAPPLAPSRTIPQADPVGSASAFPSPPPQTQMTPQQVPAPPPSPFGVPVPSALQPLVKHFFPQGFDTNNTQAWPSAGTSVDGGVQPNPTGSAGAGPGFAPAQLTPQQVSAPPSPFGVPVPEALKPLLPHFFPQGFDTATQSWPSTGTSDGVGTQPNPAGSAWTGLDITRWPMTSQQASAPPVPPIDVPIPEALRPLVPFFFP